MNSTLGSGSSCPISSVMIPGMAGRRREGIGRLANGCTSVLQRGSEQHKEVGLGVSSHGLHPHTKTLREAREEVKSDDQEGFVRLVYLRGSLLPSSVLHERLVHDVLGPFIDGSCIWHEGGTHGNSNRCETLTSHKLNRSSQGRVYTPPTKE
jgi:hypothetical protein